MPNKKSAMKRLRQDEKKHTKNKAVISELRTLAKKARVAIEANDKAEADENLKAFESKMDRAAQKNIIKRNNAARRVSRLRQQCAKIEA